MKVGEYIRTKDGIIDKVIIEYNGKCASPNIIDLIEVGDYVNGAEVLGTRKDNENNNYLEIGIGNYVVCIYRQEDIKSIVTKEQFSQMEYRIEE